MIGHLVQGLLWEQVEAHGGVTVRWTPPEGGLPPFTARVSHAFDGSPDAPQTRTFRGGNAGEDALDWILEVIQYEPTLWAAFAEWYGLEGDAADEYDWPYASELADYYWTEGMGWLGDFEILPPE